MLQDPSTCLVRPPVDRLTLLDLAEVLFLTGDREGAARRVAAAARRYVAKGNRAGLRRAQRYAERVTSGHDPLS